MAEKADEAIVRIANAGKDGATALSLSGLGLKGLPDVLLALTGLTELDLSENALTSVPQIVRSLKNLRYLSLGGNRLTSVPDWLGELTHLTTLDLGDNELTQLPDSLRSLTELTGLHLHNNKLVELPDALAGLRKLSYLSLTRNRLTALPDWIGALAHLRSLLFEGNPLISPPPEVVASGASAVLAFLRDRATIPTVRLWASKLLVVGEATVGKTSLAKQLIGAAYDPDEGQTHGVHVDLLELKHPSERDVTMALTIWDFGGQLEYRATQRFYLTDRSLFVLVWNARARWRDGKITAWLDVIAARAPSSPVLIVATHGDEPSPAMLPDDLRERYPQIAGTYIVDAKSGMSIDSVREAIRRTSAQLPLMGVAWPANWVAAGDAVRALEGDAVSVQKVWAAMAEVGVTDPESQRAIVRALHDLGDVVYFADDSELNRWIILRPQWLDARITRVLDSPQVTALRGVLTRVERDRLWADIDDPGLHERLVRMMERFDLAYLVGDADQSEDVALIVERLGDTRPPGVDELWDRTLLEPDVREIGIIYKLKSRQAGIPTWFIARQHRYTTGLHWAHGVLLHDRDPRHPAYALVVDDERDQPTITLKVRGSYPVHFMSVLVETFENIIEHRYPGLLEPKLVPCACQRPPLGVCEHAFTLDELIDAATEPDSRTNHEVRCPRSKQWVEARAMLDGLHGSGVSTKLDELTRLVNDQTSTLQRIEQRQLDTLNGVRALLAHRTQTGVHCPSLFSVEDLGRSGLVRRRTVKLSLWCEWPYAPYGPHALDDDEGAYFVSGMPQWLRDYLPFLHGVAVSLGIAAQLFVPSLAVAGVQLGERAKAGFELADRLTSTFADELPGSQREDSDDAQLWQPTANRRPSRYAEVGADFRMLSVELRKLDPQQYWGGLSAVARPEDRRIVYLCRQHTLALDYPYQPTQSAQPLAPARGRRRQTSNKRAPKK